MSAPARTLPDLPARDGEGVAAMIETPKGSPDTDGSDQGRSLAVSSPSRPSPHIATPDDLRPHPLDGIEASVERHVRPQGRQTSTEARPDACGARERFEAGMARAGRRG